MNGSVEYEIDWKRLKTEIVTWVRTNEIQTFARTLCLKYAMSIIPIAIAPYMS